MTNSKIRNFFETLRLIKEDALLPYVNRTVNVCYDMNGTLVPTWYNTKLDECRVLYADKSEDYLKLDDFNGVDVILID